MNISEVTFCISYFVRPHSLVKLMRSIAHRYQEANIIVLDTGGNLSRCRNTMARLCLTPYYVMLEEDMWLGNHTDIVSMLRLLMRNPSLAGISGGVMEHSRVQCYAGQFEQDGEFVNIVDAETLIDEGRLIRCQITKNWGVFRVDALREIGWNEALPVGEHEEFFYRMSNAGYSMGCSRYLVEHRPSRPTAKYRRMRQRARGIKRHASIQFRSEASTDIWTKLDKRSSIS